MTKKKMKVNGRRLKNTAVVSILYAIFGVEMTINIPSNGRK